MTEAEQLHIHNVLDPQFTGWEEVANFLNHVFWEGRQDTKAIIGLLEDHARQPHFLGIFLRAGEAGELLGIITAFSTDPVQAWYDDYADVLDPRELDDAFVIAELALKDTHRGRGIGGKLVEVAANYAHIGGATAVLATIADNNSAALKLADRHAFTPITDPVERFNGTTTRIYKRDLGS